MISPYIDPNIAELAAPYRDLGNELVFAEQIATPVYIYKVTCDIAEARPLGLLDTFMMRAAIEIVPPLHWQDFANLLRVDERFVRDTQKQLQQLKALHAGDALTATDQGKVYYERGTIVAETQTKSWIIIENPATGTIVAAKDDRIVQADASMRSIDIAPLLTENDINIDAVIEATQQSDLRFHSEEDGRQIQELCSVEYVGQGYVRWNVVLLRDHLALQETTKIIMSSPDAKLVKQRDIPYAKKVFETLAELIPQSTFPSRRQHSVAISVLNEWQFLNERLKFEEAISQSESNVEQVEEIFIDRIIEQVRQRIVITLPSYRLAKLVGTKLQSDLITFDRVIDIIFKVSSDSQASTHRKNAGDSNIDRSYGLDLDKDVALLHQKNIQTLLLVQTTESTEDIPSTGLYTETGLPSTVILSTIEDIPTMIIVDDAELYIEIETEMLKWHQIAWQPITMWRTTVPEHIQEAKTYLKQHLLERLDAKIVDVVEYLSALATLMDLSDAIAALREYPLGLEDLERVLEFIDETNLSDTDFASAAEFILMKAEALLGEQDSQSLPLDLKLRFQELRETQQMNYPALTQSLENLFKAVFDLLNLDSDEA